MSSGPNLGGPPKERIPPEILKTDDKPSMKKKSKEQQNKIYFSKFIHSWGVKRRKLRKTYTELMSREMKTKVHISTTNTLFKEHIKGLMQGQIDHFNELIDEIKQGKDDLSRKIQKDKKDKKARASTVVFERLIKKIEDEIKRLDEGKIEIMKSIEAELKKNQDTRLEPRTGFWTLILSGLILHNIKSKVEEEFEILMRVALEYDNVYKHTLVIFLHFVYYLIDKLPPFGKEDSRTNMVVNAKQTGYSMAHWIKYRYGTSSQYYMEYERFVTYYARSFGLIRGRAPDYKRKAYHDWLDRTFKALGDTVLSAELFQDMAKGQTIEGVLAGLIERMKIYLDKRKYDENGKLLNQPLGGDGALRFLEWLLEVGVNRYNTSNFTIQTDIRLDLGMFDFIYPTIKWENEIGERITVDWLGLDDEETEEE